MESMIYLSLRDFFKIKTNYLKALGYSFISIIALLLVTTLIIIIDLLLFGFNTNSARTWEAIAREYIINYGSLMIVGGVLLYLTILKYLKRKYKDFKIWVVTLLATIIVFAFRFPLLGLLLSFF